MSSSRAVRFGILAYGPSGRMHREAAAAVLTVHAHRPPDAEIALLTDRPRAHRWLDPIASVQPLSADTIARWQGPRADRYRPKIEALRALAASARHVVLFDTDSMARRELTTLVDRLVDGSLVLHRREYALAAPPRKGDRSLRREILGRTWDGIAPGPDAAMWNGGVIGSSARHTGVFERTLTVFDEMRDASAHFAVEQLAYSIVFPEYGPVVEAWPWFDHYWANRDGFGREIARFLDEVRRDHLGAEEAAERLGRSPIVAPLDARVPWWRRRLRRLMNASPIDDDHIPESIEP